MVALRKDVKVGLGIGAIAVAVIGVYAGLSALAGEKPADAAHLNTTPIDLAARPADPKPVVESITSGSSGSAGSSREATPPPTPVKTGDNSPTIANGSTAIPAAADGTDPWGVAFGSGNLPAAVTQQPTPGTSTPRPDPIADQKSTIEAIQGKIASTNDGSGSLATGGTQQLVGGTGTSSTGGANASEPSSPEKTHTIAPGETFTSLAIEYYGDGKYFTAIVAANPQVNPNRLKPGTVVKVPPLAKKDPKSDTAEAPAIGTASAATIDPTKQYVVKSGDSLHKIARVLYNDSDMHTKIYELNKSLIGPDETKIKIGMVLQLPKPPTELVKK